jgi:hypothetical protein
VSSSNPLAAIVRELDRAAIPHMLAGSFASPYHGDPRTTNDIDLVIAPTRASLETFVRSPSSLPPQHAPSGALLNEQPPRNLSTPMRHSFIRFTEQFLLSMMFRVG